MSILSQLKTELEDAMILRATLNKVYRDFAKLEIEKEYLRIELEKMKEYCKLGRCMKDLHELKLGEVNDGKKE
jgi:hypothetical protein